MQRILNILLFPVILLLIGCSEEVVRDYDNIPKEKSLLNGYDKLIDTSNDNGKAHSIDTKKIGSFSAAFNDENSDHLEAAEENGIKPIKDLKDIYSIKTPISKVETCDEFFVDNDDFSHPFLVDKAYLLLKDIGRMFTDTVKVRSGQKYFIRVTRMLLTDASVKHRASLRKIAKDDMAYQYGTTFDISYSKFKKINPDYILNRDNLKRVLGEILYDLRKKGRCCVTYVGSRNVFRITVL